MADLAVRGGRPAVSKQLAVRWPVIGGSERKAVLDVLDSGILNGPSAPQLRGLEEEFAAFVDRRFCLATNSGTAALHMALAAGGIGPGDEVITSAFTYVATALAILYEGAVPVFADIDPRTFNVDPALVEERITSRTRALMPVHLHGLVCDMDAINDIARRHGLLVIEDAAQAHGALYRGRQAGALGEMAGFSLNATKNLACGEGGLLVTNDERFLARARRLRLHGIEVANPAPFDPSHPLDEEGDEEVTGMGWMYLPQEIPAAIARAQLRRLREFNENAAANAAVLTSRLSGLPGVIPPFCPSGQTHVYHKYRVRLDPEAMGVPLPPARLRDRLLAGLRAEGVEAVLWGAKPVPEMELFRRLGAEPGLYPRTSDLLDSSLVLGSQSYPLFPQPRALIKQWADAFEKVVSRVSELPDSAR